MKFSTRWINVALNLATGIQPVDFLERPLAHGTRPNGGVFNKSEVARVGDFWVPQGSVLGPEVDWAVTRTGRHIRVPVHAYRSPPAPPPAPGMPLKVSSSPIFATGLEVGMAALASLRQHTADEPLAVMLVLNEDCDYLGDSFRCYVGIVIQTR